MKRLRITVEGKTYEVTVELPDETKSSAPVASAGVSAPASSSPVSASLSAAGPGVVVSPLGGNVVGVHVTVGQEVKEGDLLVTLEAMKMNTYINATAAGKVAEVMAAVGTPAQEGQALVRIE